MPPSLPILHFVPHGPKRWLPQAQPAGPFLWLLGGYTPANLTGSGDGFPETDLSSSPSQGFFRDVSVATMPGLLTQPRSLLLVVTPPLPSLNITPSLSLPPSLSFSLLFLHSSSSLAQRVEASQALILGSMWVLSSSIDQHGLYICPTVPAIPSSEHKEVLCTQWPDNGDQSRPNLPPLIAGA